MIKKPRSRVVMFRLSQDEYGALKDASERIGARNISDFTRSEVLDFLKSSTRPARLDIRFAAIEGDIAGLKASIDQLNHLLEGTTHVEPAAQV